MSSEASQTFHQGLTHLLESRLHADLVLRFSDGQEIKVHKAIMCAQSKFFLKACNPDSFGEGQEGVVNIVVGEISTIARMVLYIYSLDYSDETTTSDNNKLVCNAKLFQAAEFYIIPHLQKLAVTKFETAVSEAYVVDQFLGAIEVIYANPTIDPALRNLVADVCVKQHSTLIAYQGFIDMLSNTPELGKDLTLSFLPAAAKVEQLTKLLLHSKIKNKKV